MSFDIDRKKILYARDKYRIVKDSDQEELREHYKIWSLDSLTSQVGKLSPGDKILYEEYHTPTNSLLPEKYHNEKVVRYPKIGIFINLGVVDQAMELEYVPYQRTWGWKEIEFPDGRKRMINDTQSEIESMIMWHDDIFIYGNWATLPSWQELKPYYYKTWYYKQTKSQRRDRIINSII